MKGVAWHQNLRFAEFFGLTQLIHSIDFRNLVLIPALQTDFDSFLSYITVENRESNQSSHFLGIVLVQFFIRTARLLILHVSAFQVY